VILHVRPVARQFIPADALKRAGEFKRWAASLEFSQETEDLSRCMEKLNGLRARKILSLFNQ
jgi:hypothetical protein